MHFILILHPLLKIKGLLADPGLIVVGSKINDREADSESMRRPTNWKLKRMKNAFSVILKVCSICLRD